MEDQLDINLDQLSISKEPQPIMIGKVTPALENILFDCVLVKEKSILALPTGLSIGMYLVLFGIRKEPGDAGDSYCCKTYFGTKKNVLTQGTENASKTWGYDLENLMREFEGECYLYRKQDVHKSLVTRD